MIDGSLEFDTDFRGDQYFIRIYYFHPLQNTFNNMKNLKQEIQEVIKKYPELKESLSDLQDKLKLSESTSEMRLLASDTYFAKTLELQDEINKIKKRAENKIKALQQNLVYCSEGSRSREIIESNIRVCESILNGDSAT